MKGRAKANIELNLITLACNLKRMINHHGAGKMLAAIA